MRGDDLLDKMAFIDAEYIEEAEKLPEKKPEKKPRPWVKWVAVAACVACVAVVGAKLLPDEPAQTLPLLTIEETTQGMGFEGYMAHDVEELVNANPCKVSEAPKTLPVYKNTLLLDEHQMIVGGDEEAMRAALLECAKRLGLNCEALNIEVLRAEDVYDESTLKAIKEEYKDADKDTKARLECPEKLTVTADGVRIEVERSLVTTVFFEPAVALPEGERYTDSATYEELTQVADDLKDTYADLIGMDNPQVNIYGGDYTYDGKQMYHLEFFEGAKDDTQALLNYHFNRVAFYADEQGMIYLVRFFHTDLSDKLGDYPIISAEEAQALLSEGHYLTSVPHPFLGEDAIKKVELVYRNSQTDATYMPYYRFYVELPPLDSATQLHTYGAYYVPAVESKYIENMPSWDGSFNS